jgi:hypothetical protein
MYIKQPQLKYMRPQIPIQDGLQVGPSMVHRVYMPEHFLNLLDECSSIITPISGRQDSFYHSLLYMLYPEYKNANWCTKQALVHQFIQENHGTDHIAPHLNSAFMRQVTNTFNINLIVVDKIKITKFICVCDTISVFLYFDDLAVYQPIFINGSYLVYNFK